MLKTLLSAVAIVGLMPLLSFADVTPKDPESLHKEVDTVLAQMEKKDANLKDVLDKSYAYAVFPSIGEGALVAGGGYGHGEVYQNGKLIGWADMTQGTFGLQAGGKKYAELVLFENEKALQRFQDGNFTWGGNVSAIGINSGASKSAQWQDGVMVFTMPEAGLMAEVAIKGQKFNYKAIPAKEEIEK